ncbi:unnamed protein product [Ectocarpus sp. 8 AP-2014]
MTKRRRVALKEPRPAATQTIRSPPPSCNIFRRPSLTKKFLSLDYSSLWTADRHHLPKRHDTKSVNESAVGRATALSSSWQRKYSVSHVFGCSAANGIIFFVRMRRNACKLHNSCCARNFPREFPSPTPPRIPLSLFWGG